jgi:hypothetical protein
MASISMVIAPKCKQFVYCIEEDYPNGDQNLYREGDDDDDSGYDYAPAA